LKFVFSSKRKHLLPTDQVKQRVIDALPNIRRFAYSLTGNGADADDLVQSLVERLLKTSIPLDANPLAWMLRVCRNIWIDEVRKRQTSDRYTHEIHQTAESNITMETGLIAEAEQQQILEAIKRLPLKQREVLCLVTISGLAYADAAGILDIPVGTVMSRLARARDAIAKAINLESEEK